MSNKEFSNRVRGALIQRGTTLAAWARSKGYNVKTTFSAVYGHRRSKLSKRILARLEKEIAA